MDSTNPATFGEGTIQDVANHRVDTLLSRLNDGSLELSPYAVDTRTATVYTLAFGGPGAALTILYNEDGGAIGGFYEYGEASGLAAVPITSRAAQEFDMVIKGGSSDE